MPFDLLGYENFPRSGVCGDVGDVGAFKPGTYSKRDYRSPIAATIGNNIGSPFARKKKWDKGSPRLQAKTKLCGDLIHSLTVLDAVLPTLPMSYFYNIEEALAICSR